MYWPQKRKTERKLTLPYTQEERNCNPFFATHTKTHKTNDLFGDETTKFKKTPTHTHTWCSKRAQKEYI